MRIDFEDIVVPEEELDVVIHKSIKKLYLNRRKKRIKNLSIFMVIVVSLVSFLYSNPTLAAKLPLIGHLFEVVEDKQVFSGDIHEYAEIIKEDTTLGAISTDNGITISFSEIYANSEGISLSVILESEQPFPENRYETYPEYITVTPVDFIDIYLNSNIKINNIDLTSAPLYIRGTYTDDHTFVGATYIMLTEEKITDEFQLSLSIDSVSIMCEKGDDNEEDSKKEIDDLVIEGEWKFSIETEMNQEDVIEKEIYQSVPNNRIITTITKTPREIVINMEDDTENYIDYNGEGFSYVVFDANGKYMTDKAGSLPVGGHDVSKIDIYFYSMGTKDNQINMELQAHFEEEWAREEIIDMAVQHIEVVF